MKVEVGQKLWLVPDHRRAMGREVTVTKIGRKWASLSGNWDRFDMASGYLDGGYSSPGRVYRNQEEHEAMIRRDTLAASLISRLYLRNLPIEVTEADIRQAAALLRLEIEP